GGAVAGGGGGGRALGVGGGWLLEEIGLLGFDPHTRGRRMDEMIEVMRRFWHGGTAEFAGKDFAFGPTGMYPCPDPPPPVWIGGEAPPPLRRAARHHGGGGGKHHPPGASAPPPPLRAAAGAPAAGRGAQRPRAQLGAGHRQAPADT